MLRTVTSRLASRLCGARDLQLAGSCGARGFATGFQEPSKGPQAWWRDDKWAEPKALYDETVRRFESKPPPGIQALHALLQRISKKEEASLAIDLVDRFQRERSAKKVFGGVGGHATLLLLQACLRVGDVAAATTVLSKHASMGLNATVPMVIPLMRAAANEGANATAAAYQAARSCGLALDPSVVSAIISGLTRGEGGSVERAVAASEAFVAQGVKMSPRAFATIAVAAASQGNVEATLAAVEKARAIGFGKESGRLHLSLSQALLLKGAPADEVADALVEAAKGTALAKLNLNVGLLMQKWPSKLPSVDEGLKPRFAEALAAAEAKGTKLDCDVEAAFGGAAAATPTAAAKAEGGDGSAAAAAPEDAKK